MKISIIIPVYNTETMLHRCLNSVMNQTLKEFECYLIDDGSTDKSGEICDEFATKDSRFKVIHQKNIGVSKSMNKVSPLCLGEYIGTIDSDDYIEPDFYELLYNKAKEFDIDLIKYSYVCNYYTKTNESKKIKIFSNTDLFDKIIMPYYPFLLSHSSYTSLWNGIYKKTIWDTIKFNENIPSASVQDVYPTYKLIENSNKLYIMNNCKYIHFDHENMHGKVTEESLEYLLLEHKNLIETSKKSNLLINIIIAQLMFQFSNIKPKENKFKFISEIKKIFNEFPISSLKYCNEYSLKILMMFLE